MTKTPDSPSRAGCYGTKPDDPIGWCSTHEGWVDHCPPCAHTTSLDSMPPVCSECGATDPWEAISGAS